MLNNQKATSSLKDCIDLGNQLLDSGQLEQALDAYYMALEHDPNSSVAYFKLGELLLLQDKISEAYHCFSKACDLESDFHWAHYGLGQVFAIQGKTIEAIQAYQQALKLQTNELLVHQKLGEVFLSTSQLSQAEEQFRKVIELDPNFHWAYYRLGQVLAESGKQAEAIKAMEQTLQVKPDFELASEYLESIQTNVSTVESLSLPAQEGVEEVEPTNNPSKVREADHFFENSNHQEAIKIYEKVLDVDPNHYHAQLRKGECLLRLKRYAEAEKIFLAILENFGNTFWLLICLGQVYFEQSQVTLAVSYLEKAVQLNQDNLWGWCLLGKSYQSLNQDLKALDCFKKVVELAPHQSLGYLSLAPLYNKLGHLNDAELNWKKAIELEPRNKWPYIALGNLALESKKSEQAEAVFTQSLNLFPNDFDVVFGASSVYIAQRNWTRAVAILEQALSINPEQQNVRVRLLELYCYANNLDAAQSQFEYLQSSPNPPHSYYQAAAKFFSETRQWNLAFDFASQAVIVEPKNRHNHRLFLKVVRKTRRYLEALEVLERVISRAEIQDPKLLLLKSSILEHLLYPIQEAKKCITDLKTLSQPIIDINIIEKRLNIKESLFSQVVAPSQTIQTRFFYCTDLAYSLPTLVSIYSLWKYNQTQLGHNPISVIADQSTLDFIEGAYTTVAKQLNFNLNLVNIESLVEGLEHQKLATQYGVFSGGDSLVPTAYYRLFFAQHLKDFSDTFRWLYIDSDTLILNTLEAIDDLDLKAQPIAARQERNKPEIIEAIEINNLASKRYYNSGILAFDPQHPQLQTLIKESIRVSIEEGNRLLYHDQCALNIAFDGFIADLPDQFNDFYPPSDTRTLDQLILESQSSIIHLLDRPKPWDTLNHHRGSFLWFQTLKEMARFIPLNELSKLFEVLQSSL